MSCRFKLKTASKMSDVISDVGVPIGSWKHFCCRFPVQLKLAMVACVTIAWEFCFHQTFWVELDDKSFCYENDVAKVKDEFLTFTSKILGWFGIGEVVFGAILHVMTRSKHFCLFVLWIGDYELSSVSELIPKYVLLFVLGIIFKNWYAFIWGMFLPYLSV